MRQIVKTAAGLLLAFAVPVSAQNVPVVAQWNGKLPDRSLEKAAPSNGVIHDQTAWKRLWEAWKPAADMPEIDFDQCLVLVGTVPGPNRVMLRPTLTDAGDLRFLVAGTKMGGPGFGYALVQVNRQGVKSVNGKPLLTAAEFHGTLTTGIMAIGGETTGIILKTDKGTWELDLQGDAKLLKSAEQLDGKSVTVKGTATTREGVEIPQRRIIQVVEMNAKTEEAKAALTGTVVIPAGLASFSGHTLEVKLWQYDPRLADVSADLFDELIVKDYAHETGTDTKTPFRLGKAQLIQADRSYYVTVFVTKDGKRTHMGEQDGKRGLCKVLHGNPTEVKMIARALGR